MSPSYIGGHLCHIGTVLPLNYHEHTQMTINPPEGYLLQLELDHFHKEATKKNSITKKASIMFFNATRSSVSSPEFLLSTSEILQTKTTHKIASLQVQNDLKLGAQIEQVAKKASKTSDC